jgi:ABC-type transport system involved in cytochrome c biogenesis permease subunit
MIWSCFSVFYAVVALLWVIAILFPPVKEKTIPEMLALSGIVVLGAFILVLWIMLERPPMKTLAETRLWYSFLLPVAGLFICRRWKYRWLLSYCLGLALLFLTLVFFKPDTFDQVLMPALQSIWFVPHVIVYMIAYALLAASSVAGIKGLFDDYRKKNNRDILILADNLVYLGASFLLFGLLLGAIWAKEAWGHYWTWDPKETWAYLSWFIYLLYIHWRFSRPDRTKEALWILSLAFIVLLICWMGINYLPGAVNSVHTYSA